MEVRGPSLTAQRVAAHRLCFDRVPTPFGRAHDDECLARDVAGSVEVRRERMHRYLLARTEFFDRVVVAGIAQGIDQVVVLGAGYDGRSLRYAHDAVRYYEVDLAATQADKLERLGRLGIDASHVCFVVADFTRDDVGAVLVAAGLAARPALFLLEGVVPYLDAATLSSLLTSIGAVASPKSRLAVSVGVTHDPDDARAVARSETFRATVAALGEPVRSSLTHEAAEALLAAAGWTVERSPDAGADDGSLGLVVAQRGG